MGDLDQGLLPFDGEGPRVISIYDMPDLVERSKRPCSTCGCRSALNPHRMCKRKVTVLHDLARFLREGDSWVRVEHGRVLIGADTLHQRSSAYRAGEHVSRARWFGLAVHRGERTAQWRISTAGLWFLRGELTVPEKILCTDGAVIYESIESVSIDAVRGVELDRSYWDSYPWSDMADLLTRQQHTSIH
jgi:hypothetical protein